MRGLGLAVVGLVLLGALAGCGEDEPSPRVEPTTSASSTPAATSSTATAGPATTTSGPPCDPGGGFPRTRPGCPDAEPDTGWVRVGASGRVVLQPFRTLTDDDEARAYAEAHGLEFPFPNDHLDVPSGARRTVVLGPDTVCTGIIVVGYREPLADHAVPCDEFVAAARSRRVPAALWVADGDVVQLSELYRP